MQAVEKHYLQPFAGSGRWSGRVARLFQTLGASVQDWLHNRAERLRLAQLDERMLSDLGLSRGDVDREYAGRSGSRSTRRPWSSRAGTRDRGSVHGSADALWRANPP